MKKTSPYILAIVWILLSACKKEMAESSATASTLNNISSVGPNMRWQGAFISKNGLPASRFIQDSQFIKGGYARIFSDSVKISKTNYYSTGVRIVIPASININADSLNVEVGLKNPSNSAFYSPYYGRDVTIYLKGETNVASVTNTATSDVNPGALARAGLKFGRATRYNLPLFQYNFEDFGMLVLQTFNGGLVGYRNNEYLAGLAYGNEPPVGRLKEIGIVFQGSGFIDYIKVYNSLNNKLRMSEDFNTDGKSTVIWY